MTDGENGSPMIAVRPPEYWPSPLTFALADVADRLVLGDTLQYSRQSFQNRARLRTPDGWQWITVPLKGGQHGLQICDVEIRNKLAWMGKHWRALHFNYRTSPFFEFYEPRLQDVFDRQWSHLGPLTCTSVELIADLMGIATPIIRASNLESAPDTVPDVLKRCSSNRLLTGSDTVETDRKFSPALRVVTAESFRYRQNFEGFEPGMSTLDLLFNYGPDTLPMIRRAVVEREEATSRSACE